MAASPINSDSKMEALEIEEDIAEAIRWAGPDGLSYKDGCEAMGIDYDRFYLLIARLVQMGRLKVELSRHGNQDRIFLPQQEPPSITTLTDKQKEVLDLLVSVMDEDGIAVISYVKIAKRTSCSASSFVIDRLDKKGFLEIVDRGGHQANIYRVYPKQDGPRGFSPMCGTQWGKG